MFRHILIPTDGSVLSEKAIKEGIRLAVLLHAKVTAFHVIPKFHASDVLMGVLEVNRGDYDKAAREYADSHLASVKRAANEGGATCDVAYTTSDDPAGEIIAASKRYGCDLILMASHGRHGMQEVLLGSETHKVLTHSHIPVLVYR